MAHIKITDLKLALADLFEERLAALRSSTIGAAFESLLRAKYDAILAIPETFTSAPFADQLNDTDNLHDGFGGAVHFIIESYILAPDTPEELRDMLERARDAFIPARANLNTTYATEAANAKARIPKLEEMSVELEAVPIAGGLTLKDWISNYLNAGIEIGELLSQRANIDNKAATEARKRAAVLRMETLGLINQVRDAIRQEIEMNSSLPADLDSQIFGYFDTLEAMRSANASPTSSTASTTESITDSTAEDEPEVE